MTRGRLFAGVASIALVAGPATAADVLTHAPVPAPAPSSWNGGYVGITAGGAWSAFATTTSTGVNPETPFSNGSIVGAVNAAGANSAKTNGFATGIEAGYNWQNGPFLLGVEADLQSLHLNGAASSGAVRYPNMSGQFFTTAYTGINWLMTARARAGLVAENGALVFVTGGLAVTHLNTDYVFSPADGVLESAKLDATRAGYAIGAGGETPLTDRLSVKAEYLYVKFSDATISGSLPAGGSAQAFTHTTSFAANILRLGLNYRFAGVDARPGGLALPVRMPQKMPAWQTLARGTGWEVEAGARVWFSSGTIGAPQPLLDSNGALASRITFAGQDAVSGETFARIDHASGVFVKGFLGAGAINRGTMNDEDFPGDVAYSNTLQSSSGSIGYGTIDLGFAFLRAPGASVGVFAGYNYYHQHVNTYGCAQLAGDEVCAPAGSVPANVMALAEDDRFNSLRLGVSAQVMLTDRLKLTAEAAYLPWVNFAGQDDHNLRQLLVPEASASGNGVMLEGILGYDITEAWNVGIGGRYWAWNMRTGDVGFNFLGSNSPLTFQPGRFTSERYGMFVQTSYRWGDRNGAAGTTRVNAAPAVAMDWSGFYLGGHLGGGRSNDSWSDPFGPTPAPLGSVNVAGFGDAIHAGGPLGGGQIGFNLQSGRWVFGVAADASAADLRGENTCFSGLGGTNCQRVVNALGAVTGRVGYAFDRSLAYAKGGAAWTRTTYEPNGNTGALTLGSGSTGLTSWGWTAGGGIEYALTSNWTTFLEYDRIGLSGANVPFPTVAVINAQAISVRQQIDVVKLGVNYKFDWGTIVAQP